jgi:hypothetical protein
MRMIVEQLVKWRLAGETEVLEKTCPSATLSTTNPTWPDPGHRGGKPATNRLSYGAASTLHLTHKKERGKKFLTNISNLYRFNKSLIL